MLVQHGQLNLQSLILDGLAAGLTGISSSCTNDQTTSQLNATQVTKYNASNTVDISIASIRKTCYK